MFEFVLHKRDRYLPNKHIHPEAIAPCNWHRCLQLHLTLRILGCTRTHLCCWPVFARTCLQTGPDDSKFLGQRVRIKATEGAIDERTALVLFRCRFVPASELMAKVHDRGHVAPHANSTMRTAIKRKAAHAGSSKLQVSPTSGDGDEPDTGAMHNDANEGTIPPSAISAAAHDAVNTMWMRCVGNLAVHGSLYDRL